MAQVERGEPLARHGALGVTAAAAEGGVRVMTVVEGMTGAQLQLKTDDIITKINGNTISQPGQLGSTARRIRHGETLQVEILRDGKTVKLTGKMVGRPKITEEGIKVVYDQVKVGDRRIRVIATHPEGKGPFPTLFLIGGIGAYSVDAPFATAPYGSVIGPFARSGFATIRVEKPGQGDSEGPAQYTDLLFEDELKAYVGGMRLAKTLPFVDKDKIAVFGHSMGGTFGPLLFSEEPFAALIVNGTLARTWFEYQLENTRRQVALAGASPSQVDQFMRPVATINHLLYNEGMSVAEIREKRPELGPTLTQMSPDGKTMSGVGIPFFQQLAKRNLGAAWEAVTVPTLVTWGENDFISGETDHILIRDQLNARKPGLAEYVKLANSDHGFNQTSSFRDSMTRWGQPGATFNPNIVETMRGWFDRVWKRTESN